MKYLKDLQGFKNLGAWKNTLGGNYGVFGKGKFLAVVHLDDEEVAAIFNRKKKIVIYKDPMLRRGEKMLGFTLEAMMEEVIEAFRETSEHKS